MKKLIPLTAGVVTIAAAATFGIAEASQGSGQSATNRNDDFVVICHYDRNQQGPNAGPHTITINRNALDHHLANHVKKDGFVGDDALGSCDNPSPEPTGEPTSRPTEEPTELPD